jgi:hypothetical protein
LQLDFLRTKWSDKNPNRETRLAHVWVPGEKTTGRIVKKFGFMSVRILSFNAIHSVIKKMFHKGPVATMGPVRNGIFYFWIFFNETLHIRP